MLRTLALVLFAVVAFVLVLKLVGVVLKLVAVLILIGLLAAAAWLVLRRR